MKEARKKRDFAKLLREMRVEWKWLLRYIKKYWWGVALYILIGLVGTAMGLGSSVAGKYLIDAVVSHDSGSIGECAALVIGLAVTQILLNAGVSWISARVGSRVHKEIRGDFFAHLIRADWEDVNVYHSGDLINRLEGDISTVAGSVITFLPSLVTRTVQFVGALCIVLYYDATMAVLALLGSPVLVLTSRYMARRIRAFSKESREMNSRILSFGEESMQNLQTLKEDANRHFARGVTHLVFHTYTHNPVTDGLPPGSSFGGEVGTPFLRGQTWWPYVRLFTDYLARCTYMLERGRPVADVLYYLGEDYAHKPDQRIAYADGVEYDYVNADVLLNRLTVRDGLWTTPEGVQYKLLWIPSGVYVSETVRRKIAAGRAVGGGVWDERAEPQSRPVLTPDVLAEGRGGAFRFCHRQDGNAEIYFLTSEGTDAWTGTVSFRTVGAAQILDPDTGTSRPLRTAVVGGRTQAEISLPPSAAAFVVIRTDSPIKEVPVEASAEPVVLTGSWRLLIDGTVLENAGLGDWLNLSGASEAVRMFSGTATYRTTFAIDGPECVRMLDLGRVEVCAMVRVNGLSCGGRWSYPYRYDVSKAVKKGTNVLEVDVTNLWFNRLRYELKHPEVPRRTWTSECPRDEFPDHPSGLFGPVVLY